MKKRFFNWTSSAPGILLSRCMLLLTLLLTLSSPLLAQDIHFSQLNRMPVLINPALAGPLDDQFRLMVSNRQQWASVANPYKTTAASFDFKLSKKKARGGFLGVAMSFFSDKAGDVQMGTTKGDFSIAYHSIIDRKNTFSGGLQLGFRQSSINLANMKWGTQFNGDQYDATMPTGEYLQQSFTAFDLGEGVCWHSRPLSSLRFNAGIALLHSFKPSYSFYDAEFVRQYRKVVIHADALIKVQGTNFAILPELMYVNQGPNHEITIGALQMIGVKPAAQITGFIKGTNFLYGLHYRVGDAVIASIGLDHASYSLRFSYDLNASKLKASSNYKGGYELSLRFTNFKSFYYSKAKF